MVHFQSSTMDAVHVILFKKLDKINYLQDFVPNLSSLGITNTAVGSQGEVERKLRSCYKCAELALLLFLVSLLVIF